MRAFHAARTSFASAIRPAAAGATTALRPPSSALLGAAAAASVAGGVAVVAAAGTPATCAGWFSSAPAKPAPPAKDTLYYFPVPGAPGEVPRVVLLLGGRDYDDKRIGAKTTPPWSELKPTARFGQMPVFKTADGREMAQSRALSRYFSKTTMVDGAMLYPEDPWVAYQIDEYIDSLEDARSAIASTFAISDPEEKMAARAAMFKSGGKVFEGFKKIDACLAKGDSAEGHMVGGKLTLADVWCFCVMNQFRAGFLDGVPTEGWLEELPYLSKVVANTAAHPAVKAHYSKMAVTNPLYAPHARG